MPQRERQTLYHLPTKRPKTGKKVENAVKHYKKLLQRKETEGDTAWIASALEICEIKLNRYGALHLVKVAVKGAK